VLIRPQPRYTAVKAALGNLLTEGVTFCSGHLRDSVPLRRSAFLGKHPVDGFPACHKSHRMSQNDRRAATPTAICAGHC
jgi:hypothetical protein